MATVQNQILVGNKQCMCLAAFRHRGPVSSSQGPNKRQRLSAGGHASPANGFSSPLRASPGASPSPARHRHLRSPESEAARTEDSTGKPLPGRQHASQHGLHRPQQQQQQQQQLHPHVQHAISHNHLRSPGGSEDSMRRPHPDRCRVPQHGWARPHQQQHPRIQHAVGHQDVHSPDGSEGSTRRPFPDRPQASEQSVHRPLPQQQQQQQQQQQLHFQHTVGAQSPASGHQPHSAGPAGLWQARTPLPALNHLPVSADPPERHAFSSALLRTNSHVNRSSAAHFVPTNGPEAGLPGMPHAGLSSPLPSPPGPSRKHHGLADHRPTDGSVQHCGDDFLKHALQTPPQRSHPPAAAEPTIAEVLAQQREAAAAAASKQPHVNGAASSGMNHHVSHLGQRNSVHLNGYSHATPEEAGPSHHVRDDHHDDSGRADRSHSAAGTAKHQQNRKDNLQPHGTTQLNGQPHDRLMNGSSTAVNGSIAEQSMASVSKLAQKALDLTQTGELAGAKQPGKHAASREVQERRLRKQRLVDASTKVCTAQSCHQGTCSGSNQHG